MPPGAATAPDGDETASRGLARAPSSTGARSRRPADGDGYGDSDGFRGSAADPVHMYLKEIGKVKLLDGALEVELAERILAGNEAAERLAGLEVGPAESLPDRSKDRVLVRRGQAAKEALIEANLRLVVSIAKRYRNRGDGLGPGPRRSQCLGGGDGQVGSLACGEDTDQRSGEGGVNTELRLAPRDRGSGTHGPAYDDERDRHHGDTGCPSCRTVRRTHSAGSGTAGA